MGGGDADKRPGTSTIAPMELSEWGADVAGEGETEGGLRVRQRRVVRGTTGRSRDWTLLVVFCNLKYNIHWPQTCSGDRAAAGGYGPPCRWRGGRRRGGGGAAGGRGAGRGGAGAGRGGGGGGPGRGPG